MNIIIYFLFQLMFTTKFNHFQFQLISITEYNYS